MQVAFFFLGLKLLLHADGSVGRNGQTAGRRFLVNEAKRTPAKAVWGFNSEEDVSQSLFLGRPDYILSNYINSLNLCTQTRGFLQESTSDKGNKVFTTLNVDRSNLLCPFLDTF